MLSFLDRGTGIRGDLTRREWLRVGGLSVLGLSLSDLIAAQSTLHASPPANSLTAELSGAMFGRAKNVIFLWLQGGPPQHETFDPKPDAPVEIRGPFQPIQTNVPGIQFCELLPRTAQRADKLAVIRSLATDDNNHDVSGYWVLTGYPYGPGSARQIKPSDWPYFGSVLKMLRPSEEVPALTSVWLPDRMRLNDNVTPAGQTGGFLGSLWDPERIIGDPASADYGIEGLTLPVEVPAARMAGRTGLLKALNDSLLSVDQGRGRGNWDQLTSFALDLVTSGKARAAFDLSQETTELRDRYGRHSWGQSCLLARRLIEGGVRLVHVNWPREPGDTAVDNPLWDTHAQNADRLQDFLCPIFDVSFAALLDDLEDRGLLNETLVVAVGEFGRTPRINAQGGRDHWGSVFSCVLAGAGISGAQVLGASDRQGAYPISDPIRPHDLTATIFHLLGIPHTEVFRDRTNRPHPLTQGQPLYRLLGDRPATPERVTSTGDEQLVPPYDASPLIDTDFVTGRLISVTPPSRDKGWRAAQTPTLAECGMELRADSDPEPHVCVAVEYPGGTQPVAIPTGARLMLAQEIRNARGGHYTFTVSLNGEGSSPELFERLFNGSLTCRLVLLRFADMNKNPLEASELASESFHPTLCSFDQPQGFSVSQFLGSTVPGSNFSIGNGLGVAVVIQAITDLQLSRGESARLRLHHVRLDFQARPRDENVTV